MDGPSSEDEQQQPSEDEQQPNVESAGVGAGVGAGAVVRVGAEAEELPQGASLTRLLPGNTRLTSCMTATLPPTTRSLMARGYIKSGWLTSTPRLEQRLRWVRLNQTTLRADQYKGMVNAMQQDGAKAPTLGALWSFQPLLLVAPAT